MPDVLVFASPVGAVSVEGDDDYIYAISFSDREQPEVDPGNPILQKARLQLQEFFAGDRRQFDLPLKFYGTDFQNKVWAALLDIPFGETRTYLQLARILGDEKCIRAAASANGRNPFAIVVPCHRVIGTDGSLTGYAGGLKRKQWLLEHEEKVLGKYAKLF